MLRTGRQQRFHFPPPQRIRQASAVISDAPTYLLQIIPPDQFQIWASPATIAYWDKALSKNAPIEESRTLD